jgi:hypothetical protein
MNTFKIKCFKLKITFNFLTIFIFRIEQGVVWVAPFCKARVVPQSEAQCRARADRHADQPSTEQIKYPLCASISA